MAGRRKQCRAEGKCSSKGGRKDSKWESGSNLWDSFALTAVSVVFLTLQHDSFLLGTSTLLHPAIAAVSKSQQCIYFLCFSLIAWGWFKFLHVNSALWLGHSESKIKLPLPVQNSFCSKMAQLPLFSSPWRGKFLLSSLTAWWWTLAISFTFCKYLILMGFPLSDILKLPFSHSTFPFDYSSHSS